jgi:hypothetical protein
MPDPEGVAMADEPQRFCLGIAYMPGPDPRISKGADGGRDYLTEAELEKAAWSFLRNGPQVNAFHMAGTEGCATVVESSIHRGPDWDLGDGIVVTKGTWLVGAILEDRMWKAALDGKVNGWSPEGTARRRKVRKEGAVTIAKSAMPDEGDEEFSELVGCDFPTMGLVGKGANGIPRFLVMKEADGSATGLLEPGFVRDLIAKAEPEPSGRERVQTPSGVTVSGSPADIAAFIHKAAQRAEVDVVAKADMSGKAINDLPDSAFAYIESGGKKDADGKTTPRSLRHFPIHDAAHVRNALSRAPQSPFGDKAMPKIRAAAKRFDIEVSKEAGVPDTVTKDAGMGPELDDGIDGMDPTVPLAEPDEMGSGDVTDPGSPAWESVDAATAQKWTSILARARVAVDLLAEREWLEAASADPDDGENACALGDVCSAIDYAISVLAPFAVAEQSEADCGEADMMAMVGKSAATDPAGFAAIAKAMGSADLSLPLQQLEYFGAVVAKSGRVLSSVNEAHIREAHQRLNTVLQSLPSAPTTDDGQPVAKEQETTVTATETGPEAVAKDTASPEAQARNADPVNAGGVTGMGQPRTTGPDSALPGDGPQAALPGDAQTPGRQVVKSASWCVQVFDRSRRFVGLADPAAILQQIAKADDGEKKAMQAVFDQDGDLIGIVDPDAIQPVTGAGGPAPDDSGDADAAPAADPADMTPAPAAETGTPADAVDPDGVAKQDGTVTLTQDVLKSIAQDAARTALDAQGAAHQEVIAKMAADKDELAEELKVVKARLETVENMPAAPKVFTNGAVPPAHQLRGQDQGTAPGRVDVAKALDLKHEMYTADPAKAKQIQDDMTQMAIDKLAAIHRR